MTAMSLPRTVSYATRIAFVVELAEHLHQYGTTAQRLEGALIQVSQKLELECEPWINPTGMIIAFSDPTRPTGDSDTTRVLRVKPGDTDLHKLCEADRIAEEVMAGTLDISDGRDALRALKQPASRKEKIMQILAFGLSSASVGGLLRLPWLDILVAGFIGLLVGLLDYWVTRHPRLREASDAISATMAGCIAVLVATYVGALNLNTVIIASLVVLMPGMALTNAINELTSQHLMSGTGRFAGAVATILKLVVGTTIALSGANLLGIHPQIHSALPQPASVEWVALFTAAIAFAVLFKAERRDYVVVIIACISGYLISRFASLYWGSTAGIFLAALIITAMGNGYARWFGRPGAVVRVPGIILLVPGSSSVRSLLTLIQQDNVSLGTHEVVSVINVLLGLVAGLLFGNLLLPPRRNL